MQSTGHSSMHALSSTSTQGSAITYVTGAVLSRGLSLVCRTWRRANSRGGRAWAARLLVAAGPATLSVRRRNRSLVDIPRSEVYVVKPVPAAPADVLALEEVALAGWPAPDTRWLGRWLLRAS